MNKTASIIAAALILIGSIVAVAFLLGNSNAAVGDGTLTLGSTTQNVQTGDTVEVTVSLDTTADYLAVSGDISYDTSLLSFEGFEDEGFLVGQADDTAGDIELVIGDTGAINGLLGTLTFKALADTGSTTIDLANPEAGDGGDAGSFTLNDEDVVINFGSGVGGAGNGFFILAQTQAVW